MPGYKTLIIKEGQEFSVYRTKEIDTNDLFWDEYVRCAEIVETIVKTKNVDNRIGCNNIIAFCGDRGTGKTSAMVNFGYELINKTGNSTLLRPETKNMKFLPLAKSQKKDADIYADFEDLVVDPSILDGGHGLLDIVLPSLYSRVDEKWKSMSEDEIENWATKYDELMTKFQAVYRDISVLKSTDRPNYEEAIYANSDRLFDLSSAVDLRVSLRDLIVLAKDFITEDGENSYFVLMIDDVDLCSGNAYRVLEEIRKYLLIPELIILMAIRIEQMEMCIRDMNYSEFKNLINMENRDEISSEINLMAYKYMLKVIPESKRINLSESGVPKVVRFIKADAEEDDKNESEETLIGEFVKNSVLSCSDILIDGNCLADISPNNLRGLINYLVYFNSISGKFLYNPDINILQNITELVIRDDEIYFARKKMWDELIEASGKDFSKYMNRILKEGYSIADEEVSIKKLFSNWSNERTKKNIKVISLIQVISALKEEIIVELGIDTVLGEKFWFDEIRKKGSSTGHIIVDTKLALERMTGTSCAWLIKQTGRNSRKLIFDKTELVKSVNPSKEIECLYRLLMFAEISKVKCSKMPTNFIDREIELGYDNFLNNMYDIEHFISDSGLIECFNFEISKTESQTIAGRVIDQIFPYRFWKLNVVQKKISNIFSNRQIQKALLAGRKVKEKQKVPADRITAGIKRVLIEAFGKRNENEELNELYEAFDLFFNLCAIGQEVKMDSGDDSKAGRKIITGIPSYLKNATYQRANECKEKIEMAISDCMEKYPDFPHDQSTYTIYLTYLSAIQAFEDYCELKNSHAITDDTARSLYRDLYSATYDVINYKPDIIGDESDDWK